MPAIEAPHIDRKRLRLAFDRAADRYEDHDALQRRVADSLFERLEWMKITPRRVLDLGCGPGGLITKLLKRYRDAEVIGCDLAPAMAKRAARRRYWLRRARGVCADAETLPFADGSADLIVSSLMLQWVETPDQVFAEVRRVLAPGGLFLFATLGPDTLKELRTVVEPVTGGPSVNRFLDLHDVGDALLRARFADPVMDREDWTVTHADLTSLIRDLRGVGVRNVMQGRSGGLLTPRRWASVEAAYRERYGVPGCETDSVRRLPASWEVVHGHAWAPSLRASAPATPRSSGGQIPGRPLEIPVVAGIPSKKTSTS